MKNWNEIPGWPAHYILGDEAAERLYRKYQDRPNEWIDRIVSELKK